MLNKEIEKTLREHMPETPAGFAERSDAQVLQLMAEGKRKHRYSWKTVLTCALVLVLGITTALAATVEDVNTLLYKYWPQAAEFLMPVNTSCEDQGIRMTVLSAAAGERNALVTFSLQDLEGDRINEYTRTGMNLEALFGGFTQTESGISLLSFDPETKTAVFAQEIKTNGFCLPEGSTPEVSAETVYTPRHEVTDLLPLMKQYGTRTDTIALPEDEHIYPMQLLNATGKIPEGMKILDPAGSLEIPVGENVYLCGFGWIDGLLHVQLRYDNRLTEDNNYTMLPRLQLQTADGYNPYDHPDQLKEGVVGFMWESEDGPVNRDEYLFACTPEELENATLRADIEYYTPENNIKGQWSVKIPMRMIQRKE